MSLFVLNRVVKLGRAVCSFELSVNDQELQDDNYHNKNSPVDCLHADLKAEKVGFFRGAERFECSRMRARFLFRPSYNLGCLRRLFYRCFLCLGCHAHPHTLDIFKSERLMIPALLRIMSLSASILTVSVVPATHGPIFF